MLLQRDAIESNLQSVFSGNCRKLAVRDKGGVSRQPYREHHATVSTTSGTQMRLLSTNVYEDMDTVEGASEIPWGSIPPTAMGVC